MLSRLERCAPEQAGVSSEALLEVLRGLDGCEQLHSLMVVRHGRVICEGWWAPYRHDEPHQMFSLSKSFTSSAIGMCVQEGRLSIDEPLTRYLRDLMPEQLTPQLSRMTARHLLTMASGHGECIAWRLVANGEQDWARAFFAHPLVTEPGSTFVYNSMATYMLSVLVTRLTGEKLLDYLMPRLFEPLGIARPEWDECPRGFNTGGWGLHLMTEDIAKFGQLYLQRGVWEGRRLLDESWIDQATSAQIDNSPGRVLDWAEGYGFQFWRCCPEGVYRGDGAYGQYCIVAPKQDLVIAITETAADMQRPLTLLWERLLPLCGEKPLPPNPTAQERLWEYAANLMVRTPEGKASAPSLELPCEAALEDNGQGFTGVRLEFDGDGCLLTVSRRDGDDRVFAYGRGDWRYSHDSWDPIHDWPHSAGRMAWQANGDLLLRSCEVDGPFRYDVTLHFAAPGRLETMTCAKNCHFWGSKDWPVFRARQ